MCAAHVFHALCVAQHNQLPPPHARREPTNPYLWLRVLAARARALQHHQLHPQSSAWDFVGLATLIPYGRPRKVLLSTVTTTLQCSTVLILSLAPWLLYPSVFRTGTLVILYHGHEMHVSAEKAIPLHLTVRWTEEINY